MDYGDNAALEGNTAFHAFRHQFLGILLGLLEIAVTRTLLHCGKRAHATIGLIGPPLEKLDFTRRFLGAGE